jgi:hypothetical protein
MDNFVDTNRLPVAAGIFTAGAVSQAVLDTKAATAVRWTLNMTRPFAVGAAQLTWVESAIAVGAVTVANSAIAGSFFEVGVLFGSTINAMPGPGNSESLRNYLADELFDAYGPALPLEFLCNMNGGW